MKRNVLLSLVLIAFSGAAAAQTPHATLKPGQYRWEPERATAGPMVIIVNLADQMAYVYRNGIRIGQTTVSTGRPGHVTPTGVFTILQKQTMHHSNLYNSAPMPFMERLTWGGVCLHAGGLPGYPSSHGCVHLPLEFAKLLYGVTDEASTTVVISDGHSEPQDVTHPGLLLPEDAPVPEDTQPPLPAGAKEVWEPQRAPNGPLAILVSGADRRIYVYRNGVRIGEAAVRISDPATPLTRAVYTMLQSTAAAPADGGLAAQRWMRVELPSQAGVVQAPDFTERVRLPKRFAADLNTVLVPGTTLYVADHPATPETTTTPPDFVVMQAGQQ